MSFYDVDGTMEHRNLDCIALCLLATCFK